jgi:hypothetical protein
MTAWSEQQQLQKQIPFGNDNKEAGWGMDVLFDTAFDEVSV